MNEEIKKAMEHFNLSTDNTNSSFSIVKNSEFGRHLYGIASLGTDKKIRATINYDPNYPQFLVQIETK